MAARHFAPTANLDAREGSVQERSSAFAGKHFREGAEAELASMLVPDAPASPFAVPVEQDDELDAAARDRVDQIMRELEELVWGDVRTAAGPEVQDEPAESSQAIVAEVPTESENAAEHEVAADPDDSAEPFDARATEVLSSLPSLDDSMLGSDAANPDADPEQQLESTLVLDRVAAALAAEGIPGIPDEQLANERPKERLEVSTDYVQDLLDIPVSNSTALVRREKQRPLGFFAAIGAFFARLFHLDER